MTLVELLIVIAVLCLLASLLLPQLRRALDGARRTKCASNQHQMYTAWSAFANDSGDRLPPVEWPNGPNNGAAATNVTAVNGPFRRWMVQYADVHTWRFWDTNGNTRLIRNPYDASPNPDPNSDAYQGTYKPFPEGRNFIVYCPAIPTGMDIKVLSYNFFGLGVFTNGNRYAWTGYEQVGGPKMELLATGMGGRRFLFLGDLTGCYCFGSGSGGIPPGSSWVHGFSHGDSGGNFTDATGVTRWHSLYFSWGDTRNDIEWLGDGDDARNGKYYPKAGYAVQDNANWGTELQIRVDGNKNSSLSLDDKLRYLGYRRSPFPVAPTYPHLPW